MTVEFDAFTMPTSISNEKPPTGVSPIEETERSVFKEQAVGILQDYLHKTNKSTKLKIDDSELNVSQMEIFSATKECLSRGSGKGELHRIGAMAEAIEHLLIKTESPELFQVPVEEIKRQRFLVKDKIVQSLIPTEKIPSIKFQTIEDPEAFHYVPKQLVNPYAQHEDLGERNNFLQKYSTNSGSALGLTLADSLLHGLNELVERHYLSLFYLSLVYPVRKVLWKKYKEKSIIHNNKIVQIETVFKGKVSVLFCKTEFNSYFSIAIFHASSRNQHLVAPVGSGSSLSLALAIKRAIDELAQVLLLSENEDLEEDLRGLKLLEQFPKLRPIFELGHDDLERLSPVRGFLEGSFVLPSPEKQLVYLVKQLKQSGYLPLFRKILHNEPKISVTKVFVSGFDRFNLIRAGKIVTSQHLETV